MAFCPNCGANVGDAKFCGSCGYPIAAQQPAAPSTPQQAPAQAPAPQQSYDQVASPYAQVQQSAEPTQSPYAQPQQPYTPRPNAPKSKKSKVILFCGIGVLLLAAVAVALYFLVIKKDPDTTLSAGYYRMTAAKSDGEVIALDGMEESYLLLFSDGTGVAYIFEEEDDLTWSEDELQIAGETLPYTYKDGKLKVTMDEDEYTFVKKGDSAQKPTAETKEPSAAPATEAPPEEPVVPVDASFPRYYVVEEASDGANTYDRNTLLTYNLDIFVVLYEDHSGVIVLNTEGHVLQWDEAYLYDGTDSIPYSSDDPTELRIDYSDMRMTLRLSNDPIPPYYINSDPEPTEDTGISYWEHDWYGWWIAYNVTGDFSEWGDNAWWDCCARFSALDEETLSCILWDEDLPISNALSEVTFRYTAGESDTSGGYLSSQSGGYFMDATIGAGDWNVTTEGAEYPDLITVTGTYTDPANAENTFDYIIVLRPWGTTWEDWYADDPTCLPYNYESWYLPLLDSGVTEAPDEIGGY